MTLMKLIILLVFTFNIVFSTCAYSSNGFSWNTFLSSIVSPRCNKDKPDLCTNLESCFYAGNYWYNEQCNPDLSESFSDIKIDVYNIVDGKLTRYKQNDKITYEANLSGVLRYGNELPCTETVINESASGEINYTSSPWTSSNYPSIPYVTDFPVLLRQELTFEFNSYQYSTSIDFFQDYENKFIAYIDEHGGYHNPPDGAVWISSPLSIGKSWEMLYPVVYEDTDKNSGNMKQLLYDHHSGNFEVVGKEIIKTKNSLAYETYKVKYNLTKSFALGSEEENGYLWIHPKIGVLKAEITPSVDVRDGVCSHSIQLSYIMVDSNCEPDNLPFATAD